MPSFADQVAVVQGSVEDRRFVAAYGYRGRLTAAVSFNQAMWLDFYKDLIEDAAPFPPAYTMAGAATPVRVLAAEFPDQAVPTHDATVVVTGHEPNERRARYVRRQQVPSVPATR